MSDPFQPAEKIHRRSFECLKVFAETQYPFVVSTKGSIIADKEYLDLISKCNCAIQISMCCSSYDRLERGAPTFNDRLEILKKISKTGKRTIVRLQPVIIEHLDEIIDNIHKFKENGAYGVIVEFMKFFKGAPKNTIKVGGDNVYPYSVVFNSFNKIKQECIKNQLKIFAGENRLRKYGDSLTCCGVGDLFKVNEYNFNHILFENKIEPTNRMCENGTAYCFKAVYQDGQHDTEYWEKQNFKNFMLNYYVRKKELINKVLGITR